MLSAAHDILKTGKNSTHYENGTETNRSSYLVPDCNPIGTGAVLLADILPGLFVKLTAPFYMQNILYSIRVIFVTVFAAASFPVVSFSYMVAFSLLGVVCASISSGFGEITFLSLSSHFDKNTVSTWSSGTGAAGVFGALSYAGLTAIGLPARDTLLVMLAVPVIMAGTYFFVLSKPSSVTQARCHCCWCASPPSSVEEMSLLNTTGAMQESTTLLEKFSLIKPLLKYMIPLAVVYFAEYFINQALFELLSFPNIWLPEEQQYRWYQVIYQVGVLISRSSVNLIQIQKLWILPILQMLNVGLLLLQVFLRFIPNIWIIFIIILYEGLLGGCAYVNTFYRISQEVAEEHREFSMGVTSIADAGGIAVAGAVAIPVHDWICTLKS